MKVDEKRISELVKALRGGDKSAFEELYKLTSPKAYFVALKICKNEHDAEDILQESYIKVLEKIDTVDPEKNFTAWLYQIVANKSKNLLKAKKPVLFSEEDEREVENLPEENKEFYPEENVDREELRKEVMAAVDELTDEKRACVMMMYFGDMGVSEIAESLEVPVSTVKNRLFTARKDLKNKFEKKGITTLYSAAPLGLVIWAIGETAETVSATFAVSAASAAVMTGIAASAPSVAATTAATTATVASATAATTATATTATAAATTATGIGAKIAAFSVAQKVIAGVAAVSVIGGSTAGVVTVVNNSSEKETTTFVEEVTTAPSQTADYAINIFTTENSTTATETQTSQSVPTATTSKPSGNSTTKPVTTLAQTQNSSSALTDKITTQRNTTTTQKRTTTTTKATTTSTKPTQTTTAETTEEETTTAETTETTTTTTTTQALPATVVVEVTDMDNNVVATLNLSVPVGTQMTNAYLVTQIKAQGYEPQAGIYGDALNATAESGKTYNLTAEL